MLVALAIYAVSRLVVILGVEFADDVAAARTGPEFWQAGDWWFQHLLRWDAGWYGEIASAGYQFNPDPSLASSIVFFPLLPLLGHALAGATGLGVGESLLVVANLAGLAAVGLLAALVTVRFGPFVAVRTAALLSFFPTSVFFSSAYAESLALALVLLAFLMLERDRLWLAALASGLATASRSVCAALVPILMLHAAMARPLPMIRRTALVVATGIVAAGGLIAFVAWQAWAFGDPLAFAKGQEAWTGAMSFGARFTSALLGRPLRSLDYASVLFLVFAGLVVVGERRLPWSWTVYAALVLLIPYVSLATGQAGMGSMPRFLLMAFPALVTLSLLLVGRPWLTGALLVAGTIKLFITTAMFSQWHWAG